MQNKLKFKIMGAKDKSLKKSDMNTAQKPQEEWLDSTSVEGTDPELDLKSRQKGKEEWLHKKTKAKKKK